MLKKKTWLISLILWYAIGCQAQRLRNPIFIGFLFTPDPYRVSLTGKESANLPPEPFFVWLVCDPREKSTVFEENVVQRGDTVSSTRYVVLSKLSDEELLIDGDRVSKGDDVQIDCGGKTYGAEIDGFLMETFPVVEGIGGGRNLFAYGEIPAPLLEAIKSEADAEKQRLRKQWNGKIPTSLLESMTSYRRAHRIVVSKVVSQETLDDIAPSPFTIPDDELRDYFIGRLDSLFRRQWDYLRSKIDTTYLKYRKDLEIMKIPLRSSEEPYLLVGFDLTTDMIGRYGEKVCYSEVTIFHQDRSVAYCSGIQRDSLDLLAKDFNGDGFIEIVHQYSPWSTFFDIIQIQDNRFIKRVFLIPSRC